jgi:hypothetical protein
MSWYIETWNPADGLAFVSRRDESGPAEVFFVGAPQFHPLPVRHVATALWATRAGFQEGVYVPRPPLGAANAPGLAEMEFKTLEQAIKFVRRVFIALGPQTTPGNLLPPVAPRPIKPKGSALVAQAFTDLTVGADRKLAAKSLRDLAQQSEYEECLRDFFIAALAAMPSANDSSPEPDENRAALLLLLEKSGLWESVSHIMRDWVLARQKANVHLEDELPQWQAGRLTGSGAVVQARLLNGLLFKVPAPVPLPSPYLRGLPTLGHHVCAASSDRAYLNLLNEPEPFLQLHAASLLLASATIDLASGSKRYFGAVAETASVWLAQTVVDRSLEEVPGAEALISQLVRTLAETNEAAFVAAENANQKPLAIKSIPRSLDATAEIAHEAASQYEAEAEAEAEADAHAHSHEHNHNHDQTVEDTLHEQHAGQPTMTFKLRG